MKQLSDIDIRISYSQAYNLAVQIVANLYSSKDNEDVKASIEKWQEYFYYKLTTGYIQKFAPQEIKSGEIDRKKSEDTGLEGAELDSDPEILEA